MPEPAAPLSGFRQRFRNWLNRVRQPLFSLGVAAICGILFAEFLPWFDHWKLAALALGALWLAVEKRNLLSLWLLGVIVFALSHRINDTDPLRNAVLCDHNHALKASVEGIVSDAPEAEPSGSWRFPLRAETINGTASRENIYVRIRGAPPPRYGDRVRVEGVLREPDPPRNPGEFDFADYLRRQGFGAEMTLTGSAFFRILGHGHGNPVMEAAISSRKWIGDAVTRDIEGDPAIAATVRAMVLGTQETTPQDIEDAFVASGTMHVFAVSGLHVALFGWVVRQFLRTLGLSWRWTLLLVIPLMFFYVFVTGLRASAWRAAIMTTVFLAGPLFDRKGDIYNNLGAASLILLGWDTQQLFQPGFQLSFGVLLALALMTRMFMAPLAPLYSADPFLPQSLLTGWQRFTLWIRKKSCESVAVSTASAIGSAPLMLHHFKLLSPIGILANLFLVALSSLILFVGCVSILCALLRAGWFSLAANNTNWLLTRLSICLAKFFAAIPGGHVRVDLTRPFDQPPCRVTVLALPDGGGATHLHCGRSHWMLDTGGSKSYLRTVRSHLLRYPADKLDGVILTHTDTDHIGAFHDLVGTFSPATSLAAPGERQSKTTTATIAAPQRIAIAPDASLEILFPPGPLHWGQTDDRCLVVRLECRGWRILFTSDAGFLTEEWLLESGVDLRADVLVKGRHASDFSGLGEFINAVAPQAVVFSNNHFPAVERVSPAWLELLSRKQLTAFDQELAGAVEIEMPADGSSMTLTGFVNGQTKTLTR